MKLLPLSFRYVTELDSEISNLVFCNRSYKFQHLIVTNSSTFRSWSFNLKYFPSTFDKGVTVPELVLKCGSIIQTKGGKKLGKYCKFFFGFGM